MFLDLYFYIQIPYPASTRRALLLGGTSGSFVRPFRHPGSESIIRLSAHVRGRAAQPYSPSRPRSRPSFLHHPASVRLHGDFADAEIATDPRTTSERLKIRNCQS